MATALRRPERWWLPVVGLNALLAAGAKASNPPVLFCGALLVTAVALVRRDRRSCLRGLAMAGLVALAYVVAMQPPVLPEAWLLASGGASLRGSLVAGGLSPSWADSSTANLPP